MAVCLGAISCTGAAESIPPPRPSLKMSLSISRDLQPALAKLDDVDVNVVVSEGVFSVSGLQNLRQGVVDITMTMADVAYLSYAGQLEPDLPPFDQLRGLAVVNLNTLHLLVAKGKSFTSIRDLRGRNVALGPIGSATALIAEHLLGAYGIPPGEIRSTRLPYPESIEKLGTGELDAAFMTVVAPSPTVLAAIKAGGVLVDVEGPLVEELRTRYPYLKRTLLPIVYPDQPRPVRTIGVDRLLVCRADVPDDVVYRLLEGYFSTRPGTQPEIDFERAPATPVPLHPGAARYYRQRELAR